MLWTQRDWFGADGHGTIVLLDNACMHHRARSLMSLCSTTETHRLQRKLKIFEIIQY